MVSSHRTPHASLVKTQSIQRYLPGFYILFGLGYIGYWVMVYPKSPLLFLVLAVLLLLMGVWRFLRTRRPVPVAPESLHVVAEEGNNEQPSGSAKSRNREIV